MQLPQAVHLLRRDAVPREQKLQLPQITFAAQQTLTVRLIEHIRLQCGYRCICTLCQDTGYMHIIHPEVVAVLRRLVQTLHHIRRIDDRKARTVRRIIMGGIFLKTDAPLRLQRKEREKRLVLKFNTRWRLLID